MRLIYFFLMFLFFTVSCDSKKTLLINKNWKLEKVYFTKYKYWGKLSNCNRYHLYFNQNGNFNIYHVGCKRNFLLHSDVIHKDYWSFKDEKLFISVFGNCIIKSISNDKLVLIIDQKNEMEGVYYFNSKQDKLNL